MRVEYLDGGSEGRSLIRLYDFTSQEAQRLAELARNLASGERETVLLDQEPWVDSVGGCQLRLVRATRDQGVRQLVPPAFECILGPTGWDNLAGLIEPFYNSDIAGFQWLTEGEVPLLISQSGNW